MSTQANAKINPSVGLTAALVAKAAAGDRDAFATLYNEHRENVYRFLVRRSHDRHLAEDLTQDVFVRALSRIDSFDGRRTGGGFAAWLSVIARNLYLDHVKKSRVQREVSVPEVFETDARDRSTEVSVMRELDIAEANETLAMAMQVLNPHQQQCVRLRFIEELSVPETAARMGKDAGAVKTLTFRAMASMRRALADEAVAA